MNKEALKQILDAMKLHTAETHPLVETERAMEAIVPVDAETTEALVAEIKKLIDVVGGMALKQQRPWVGLTDADFREMGFTSRPAAYTAIETKLKEKNHA